jgi:transcription initiation factor TFIID subunit TAF12
MSQFMSNLKNQGMSLKSIYNSFSQAGMAGQRAFMSMYGQINKMDMGLKSMSKTTDKIINTFGNTFR